MNKAIAAIVCCALCGCATFVPYDNAKMNDEMGRYVFKASNGVNLPYRIYIPDSISGKIPMVVFLHGAGERGSDNLSHLHTGDVGYLVSYAANKDGAVVIAPQCPENVFWKNDMMLDALAELIENQISVIKFVDNNRVYVTGFSMGGEATWLLAIKHPKDITAIMPVCGGPLNGTEWEKLDIPEKMGTMGIWAYNNNDDGVVQNSFSKYVLMKTWLFNLSNAHLTESLEGGHSDKFVYSDEDKINWLFSNGAK